MDVPSVKRARLDDASNEASIPVEFDESLVLEEHDFSVTHKPLVRHSVLPPKTEGNQRWMERIGSFYYPSASFVYEVNYNVQHKELGFSYQWQYLPYSARYSDRFLLYCIVSEVPANFTQVIAVGDIIVKVNDDPFFYLPGDSVDYSSLEKRLSNFVASAKTMTTIRFYRPGGANYSDLPSVIEIKLMAQEKSIPIIAKFLVKTSNKGEAYVENTSMDNGVSGCRLFGVFFSCFGSSNSSSEPQR
jgi:C-terminal processing protease CtpA/Prc